MDHLLQTFNGLKVDEKIPSSVLESAENFIQSALLPQQSYGEERPPSENDFDSLRDVSTSKLNCVSLILNKILECKQSCEDGGSGVLDMNKTLVVWTLLLCGEHSNPAPWTSPESLNLAVVCTKTLCEICGAKTISDLLSVPSKNSYGPAFKEVLLALRPKLLRETWRTYPGAVSSYQWALFHVSSPFLSDYLNMVFPTALIFIDDYVLERRLIGLSCMTHIIDNVPRTELCQQGLDKVIQKALEPLLLQHEAVQIEPTVICLTKLISKTERGYSRKVQAGMLDSFDKTLQVLLQKMVCEDRIPLRVSCAKCLPPLLLAMGPSVIRWSKPVLAVFDEYLHCSSHDTRMDMLKALLVYLEFSTCRIVHNGDEVSFLLLRTLFDITSDVDEGKTSLQSVDQEIKLIKECFCIITDSAPEQVISLKTDLKKQSFNSTMHQVVSDIFSF